MNKNKCIKWKLVLAIKTKFERLSLKELVQLYLIIIITYALIYILYMNKRTTNESFTKTSSMNNFHKKEKKSSDLELLTYFSKISKKYNIIIDEVKILDNSIQIRTEEKYQNIIVFLNIINQKFHIRNFEIKKEKNTIYFFISLDKSMLLSTKEISKPQKDIKNPFIKRSVNSFVKTPDIILRAIINDEVLIDDQWYKTGDEIYDYKIDSILRVQNKVVFVNTSTEEKITERINYD